MAGELERRRREERKKEEERLWYFYRIAPIFKFEMSNLPMMSVLCPKLCVQLSLLYKNIMQGIYKNGIK